MALGEKRQLIDELKALLCAEDRFVDMAARLRVYDKNPDGSDNAVPGELRGKLYGGRYDSLLEQYVECDDLEQTEISCHRGQLDLLEHEKDGIMRVMALGGPGAGKTTAIVRRALINCLERPNTTGGMVGATGDRKLILWEEFLGIVEPLGWVKEIRAKDGAILLKNGCKVEVLSAYRPSRQAGSPIQGRSWNWCCVDEGQSIPDYAHKDIDERGRRVGTKYKVYESCTNMAIPAFQLRKERYKEDRSKDVIRFNPFDNPWVEDEYWERFKKEYGEREFKARILAEDVPPERLVYSGFSHQYSLGPRPNWTDVTARLISQKFGVHGKRYVVGQDFGIVMNASIFLKAFRDPKSKEVRWWVVREISHTGDTLSLANRICGEYDPSELCVIADPHINSKDADKSDYHIFRRSGLYIRPATQSPPIKVKHRVSMLNALFEDANGDRALYVECNRQRKSYAPKLVNALMTMEIGEDGALEADRKDINDRSHWPSALAYGLFPFERIRGRDTLKLMTGYSKKQREQDEEDFDL
jgi:hypothetical protein